MKKENIIIIISKLSTSFQSIQPATLAGISNISSPSDKL